MEKRHPIKLCETVIFFVVFFLYIWLRIEPSMEYQHSAPSFRMCHSYFKPFLSYPGGLVDYGAAFLAQLNYSDSLGALIFTGIGIFDLSCNKQAIEASQWHPLTTGDVCSTLFAACDERLFLFTRNSHLPGTSTNSVSGNGLRRFTFKQCLDAPDTLLGCFSATFLCGRNVALCFICNALHALSCPTKTSMADRIRLRGFDAGSTY